MYKSGYHLDSTPVSFPEIVLTSTHQIQKAVHWSVAQYHTRNVLAQPRIKPLTLRAISTEAEFKPLIGVSVMRRILFFLSIILLHHTSYASASIREGGYISLGGGLSIPVRPTYFVDALHSGPSFFLGIGSLLYYSRFGFVASFEYTSYSFDAQGYHKHYGGDPDPFWVEPRVTMLSFLISANYSPFRKGVSYDDYIVCPYLLGGFGVTAAGQGSNSIKELPMAHKFALVGMGVDFIVSENVGILVDGRYYLGEVGVHHINLNIGLRSTLDFFFNL